MKYKYTVTVVEIGVGRKAQEVFTAAEPAIKAARLAAGVMVDDENLPSFHLIRQPNCPRVSWNDEMRAYDISIVKEPR